MEWRAERRTPGKVLSLRERPQRPLPGSGSASGVPFAATCAFAVLAAQAISWWGGALGLGRADGAGVRARRYPASSRTGWPGCGSWSWRTVARRKNAAVPSLVVLLIIDESRNYPGSRGSGDAGEGRRAVGRGEGASAAPAVAC